MTSPYPPLLVTTVEEAFGDMLILMDAKKLPRFGMQKHIRWKEGKQDKDIF